MQTLRDASLHGTKALAIAAAGALLLSLAGCSTPNLEAQVNEAAKPDTCESAYESAVSGNSAMAAGRPLMSRYLNALIAASSWSSVSVSCPARAAEGIVHAAQAAYTAQQLAGRLGLAAASAPSVDFGALVKLDMDTDVLLDIALEEDRAGFSLGVLAARGIDNATLAASDAHKTAAQRLVSLSGATSDPRQKVYAVDQLISHPQTVHDPANMLETPTLAAIEMNCARSYLTALTDSKHISKNTLAWLADTAKARLWHAYELGYPLVDEAVLSQQSE